MAFNVSQAERGTPEWWLARLSRRLTERGRDWKIYDDYYHRRQRTDQYLTAKLLEAFGTTFKGLSINYCSVVVDALAERLTVQGFNFADDAGAASAAWDIWQRNSLDALFARGLRNGLAMGEFSLIVWVDETGAPTIHVEDGRTVIVAADPADPRRRRAALKRWWDDDTGRHLATLYLPDAIYKYQSAGTTTRSSTWEQRSVQGEPWPLPNALGVVPVVAIPNKPDLLGAGVSELVDIIPIQDAINANAVSALLAGQFSAFPQKYGINIELETDPDTGKPTFVPVSDPGRLQTFPPPNPGEPEVKLGQFAASDLNGYIAFHEMHVQAMATISRTPPHYFLGNAGVFPSGEALRAAEAGLTSKALARQHDDGDPVEEAMRLAFRLAALSPRASSDDAGRFQKWANLTAAETGWRDPETRTESEHIDALMKQQALGVPDEILWERVPYSPQEIVRIKAIKAAERPATDPGAMTPADMPMVVPGA